VGGGDLADAARSQAETGGRTRDVAKLGEKGEQCASGQTNQSREEFRPDNADDHAREGTATDLDSAPHRARIVRVMAMTLVYSGLRIHKRQDLDR
jgi:hypothetical protein